MWRALGLTAAVITASFEGSLLEAAIIYVDDTAPPTGANDGTSWENAYRDLHDGLKGAQSGDEVRVGQGVYKPAPPGGARDRSFALPDGVIVQGGWAGFGALDPDALDPGQHQTILSGDVNGDDGIPGSWSNYGENSYHVVRAENVGRGTQLRGVVVRGGNADLDLGVDRFGGGVLCINGVLLMHECTIEANQALRHSGGVSASIDAAVLMMEHCTIRGNRHTTHVGAGGGVIAGGGSSFTSCVFQENLAPTAGSGAALMTWDATLVDCQFIDNDAGEDGGAVAGSDLTMVNCEFMGNKAGVFGGALELGGHCQLIDCRWIGNEAGEGGGVGGAISQTGPAGLLTVTNGEFRGNVATIGGALATYFDARLINCRFLTNTNHACCEARAAAISNSGTLSAVNCWFAGNFTHDEAIVWNSYQAALANCTIVGNVVQGALGEASGAVHNYSGTAHVLNCILWDNTNGLEGLQSMQIHVQGGAVNVSNSFVHGWNGSLGGHGNSGENPQMIDAAGSDNDYGTDDDDPRLSESSPCRDAGNRAWLPQDEHDLDGDGDTSELIPLDLDALPRIVSQVVDAGAYEFQGPGCPADIGSPSGGGGGDGQVNVHDLLAVIGAWGECSPGESCQQDINNDGVVNVHDLLAVIAAWGRCE